MTDSCPSCMARGIKPAASSTRGGAVVDGYRCPSCGHAWATSRLLPAYSDIHRRRTATTRRSAA